jgi:hypothetical protein
MNLFCSTNGQPLLNQKIEYGPYKNRKKEFLEFVGIQ